ncbi:MAG TPA: hypothetical protein VFA20_32590 [Myxococcaceae bacterium]|nr:hypothetical protein [Myxococcaceae bacterium]
MLPLLIVALVSGAEPAPYQPPVIDAATCATKLAFSPPFPEEPPCKSQVCHPVLRRDACAASPVVKDVAVEKVFEAHAAAGGDLGHTPGPGFGFVTWWLLTRHGDTWRRTKLGEAGCGNEDRDPCSWDEVFRRPFQIAMDESRSRVAVVGTPVYSRVVAIEGRKEVRTDQFSTWWVAYLVGPAPAFVHRVPELPAGATAQQVLDRAPRDLAAAYRAALPGPGGAPFVHAMEAEAAGVQEPLRVLKAQLTEPPRCDRDLGRLDYFARRFPADPVTYELIAPYFSSCRLRSKAEEKLALPPACREALKKCGVSVPSDRVPVRTYGGEHGRSEFAPAIETSDGRWTYLEDGFTDGQPVVSKQPILMDARYSELIASQTAVIYLGERPADVFIAHGVNAPVIVLEETGPKALRYPAPAGSRWCEIPRDACPAIRKIPPPAPADAEE